MEDQKNKKTDSVQVVDIQFRPGQKVYYFDPAGKNYNAGDHVIIDTARGPEFGTCTAGNHSISAKEVVSPLRPVLRKATAQDEKTVENNRKTEEHACRVCMEKIQEQGLDMQLVSAECAFDGSKILFFFTADERVDFRELVKALASSFHTRIELRQIGVRDKARMVGGLGICGRPFCCATFLDDFQPVSIKMAKTQSLSLNPTKISGTCGRLMCCLKYEQDAYEDLIKNSPKPESFVDTPDGRGTVVDIELLRQRVKVQMEEQPETIGVFRNDEIAVLRSGKAKKNDPPIPADLAPISGNKKPRRRFESEEKLLSLDPIKFRYSTDTVAEAVEEAPVAEPSAEEGKESRGRNRNRRSRKPARPEQKAEKPQQADPQAKPEKAQKPEKKQPEKKQPEKPQQEKKSQEGGEQPEKKKHHRRYHHHRPKPKSGEQKG